MNIPQSIVIIDYGLGNLGSMTNMLKKAGVETKVSSDISDIKNADKLILPGVGSFDIGMKNIRERGLIPVMNKKVLEDKTPILGVCLGMQLMGNNSEEGGLHGLGWVEAESIRFKFDGYPGNLSIPHMGWNTLSMPHHHPLFEGIENENRFYFVHSYHVVCAHEQNVLAKTEYGFSFTSAIVKQNILGVQFHPEKSHKFGMLLLNNFAQWKNA
jgi:imidazole glycerol-phosphate synthase subunit HisH